ncbi:biotin-dependent carboxyltransferase family protein [Horticoccus luteus]|uniref:Biotin-dependent carboxyltransferase family protein n=1 Tax=Horticoccus luteus TaxID=2862869 RepID=A0A8F9TY65_9BACT|nr:biotin-dependent carboxyltransferase family protein [Horticoccus luteus]QYM80157.1 biotin-dependent carboxyltransferase family protein [Horticoccus luteus]
MTILRPGMATTVQDLGRTGHRHEGVPLSGAADRLALRLANLLVGNAENAAALEVTLTGPELVFADDRLVAIGGGRFAERESWHPFHVSAGERVALGPLVAGCRAIVAISGGIEVPVVLGSRSTCLRAGFGGWQGRVLHEGDVLPLGSASAGKLEPHWRLDPQVLPAYGEHVVVRVIPGAQAEEFSGAWLANEFRVSARSDRMGVRLDGAALVRASTAELVSSPVAPGTVQVPPGGQPIVLLADAQTMGGYPRVAHVIDVDLPLVANVKPGDTIRFRTVTLEEGHRLWREREQTIALIRTGLEARFR